MSWSREGDSASAPPHRTQCPLYRVSCGDFVPRRRTKCWDDRAMQTCQRPRLKHRDLRLDSTAPPRSVAAAWLWFPRPTHQGVPTRRPCSPSLAERATFSKRHCGRRSSRREGPGGTLTAEQQPFLWTILRCGMSAAGASLTGLVRIYLHRHTASKQRFVGNVSLQISEGPLRGMPVGAACWLARRCLAEASFPCLRFVRSRI